ncbi:MAG: hypothetical protein GY894_09285 [Planctomycetes bacterium]|nr:hypothetical protein [Planctomycetota bacterium]MCP4839535.1 hypothetical protein [Planctomycetota bacterium]
MRSTGRGEFKLRRKLGVIGATISIVLLGIVLLLDRPDSAPTPDEEPSAVELIAPLPLQEDGATAGGMMDPNLSVALPEGGWLQIAGDDGQLSQQYRFTHLNPNPNDLPTHWIRMKDPEVELFMTGGRLVTLAGDEADAYAPRRALEEGRLIGNVVIRMFDPVNGTAVDPSTAAPAMTITTAAAEFDNRSGRITCPGELFVQSGTEEMRGTGLRILLNDRDERIEYLEIADLDYLLLRDTGNARKFAHRPMIHPAIAVHNKTAPSQRKVSRVAKNEPPETFYRLTLNDQVRIEQAPSLDADPPLPRIVTADSLHAIFSLKSTAFSAVTPQTTTSVPMSMPMLLAAMAMAAPPAPAPEEVLVTCEGPLTMTPVDPGVPLPPTPKDMRLELHGEPVRVLDASENITATCTTLSWTSSDKRFDLSSPQPDGVTIIGQDITIASSRTWAQPSIGLGGIEGRGTAILIEAVNADSVTRDPNSQRSQPLTGAETTINWAGQVDLRFDPEGHSNGSGLRSIRFQNDVVVASPDGNIEADDLEMKFERDEQGDAVPDRLLGSGGVMASSEDQTLWADNLLATLGPAPDSETTLPKSDRIEVRDVHADGNVQVRLADGTRTWAEKLQGDARQESVELLGADVVVARGELIIEHGTSLRIERKAGVGEWAGSGRALMTSSPPDLAIHARIPRPATPDQLGAEDSEITWVDSVHLEFDPEAESQDAAMQSVRFAGKVAVNSPDGTIEAETISMSFTPDASGRSAPNRLECRQRVRAHSDGQTIWADDLTALLEPRHDDKELRDSEEEQFASRINVKDVTATGDVQVLMKDGARAFADRLHGDAAQETVLLTGIDVIIAREDVLIDRGQHLLINRLEGTADWQGSGRSRMLIEPLSLSADMRILPPRVIGGTGNPSVSMRTTWTESLHYDNRYADGAGAMDLQGSVHTVVDRSDLERSSLQGETVRLEFSRLEESTTAVPTAATDPFSGGGRVLHRLIARGDARLESRTWKSIDRDLLPRLFYVSARHVTWDDIATEAEVVGNGDIVIREPEWATDSSANRGPFSGPGTTRFVWSERLDLTHEADDRFRMIMLGDVQGMWASSASSRDTATITSEKVSILTHRSDAAAPTTPDAPLQLGGDMEIDRLSAVGRVYLKSPTRTADCHMLDYNTRTRIAELVARPGRMVSLTTQGASMPVQAARMIWNMDPAIDTITLEQPRGSGGR